MILIGRNVSPFVRRVGVTLRLMDIPYEQRVWSTSANVDIESGRRGQGADALDALRAPMT